MNTDRKEIFKSRFNEHYTRLCSLAYEYVSDADDSEDIVQELFITIWDKGKDDSKIIHFNNCIIPKVVKMSTDSTNVHS